MSINIDEKKLSKLIFKGQQNIVNVKDDCFEYSNGYILAVCNYEQYSVIQKLFKVEAIKNLRDWTPARSHDLTNLINSGMDCEAELIPFLYEFKQNEYCYIFRVNGKFYYFDKKCCDVFMSDKMFCKKNMDFKVNINEPGTDTLRFYDEGKLVGLICPMRIRHNESDLQDLLQAEEVSK